MKFIGWKMNSLLANDVMGESNDVKNIGIKLYIIYLPSKIKR